MKKSLNLIGLFTLFLTGVASAHPGPVGHTHGDDWPFGVAILIAVLIGSFFMKKKLRG